MLYHSSFFAFKRRFGYTNVGYLVLPNNRQLRNSNQLNPESKRRGKYNSTKYAKQIDQFFFTRFTVTVGSIFK